MKRKELVSLLVGGLIIAVVAAIVYKVNTGSYREGVNSEALFAKFPMNEIESFSIEAPGEETVTLVKTNNVWSVANRANYPADFQKIAGFIREVAELKPLSKETIGESQLSRVELLAPSASEGAGTDVRFNGADGSEVAAVRLGKEVELQSGSNTPSMGPSERFVKRLSGKEQIFKVGAALDSVDTDPSAWLNKDFFSVKKIRSVAVSEPGNEERDWRLSRGVEGGDWSLDSTPEGKILDTTKTTSFNSLLGFPSFTDVSTDTSLMENPTSLKITTFDDFTYDIQVGAKTDDNKYPITVDVSAEIPQEREAPEDETEEAKAEADQAFEDEKAELEEKLAQEKALSGHIYLVNTWAIENALKDVSDLVKEPEPEEETSEDVGSTDEEDIPDLIEAPEPDVSKIVDDAVESTVGGSDDEE